MAYDKGLETRSAQEGKDFSASTFSSNELLEVVLNKGWDGEMKDGGIITDITHFECSGLCLGSFNFQGAFADE